jgi:hypothetical protein
MRPAVLANTRSRVCFQLAPEDAGLLARSQAELEAEDFTSLGAFEVYASLFANGRVTPFASDRDPAAVPGRTAWQRIAEAIARSRCACTAAYEFATVMIWSVGWSDAGWATVGREGSWPGSAASPARPRWQYDPRIRRRGRCRALGSGHHSRTVIR